VAGAVFGAYGFELTNGTGCLLPLMSFRSGGIVGAGDEQFLMNGLLSIKDVELPVHLDLQFGGAGRDTHGQSRIGFEGTAVIRRSDWGLDWNAALATKGALVSDKVKLNLDISAVRLNRTEAAA
jgi:polyisoprenoid-binding protein YceI